MLDVKLLPCKEIRAWRKGKDELCDANAMVKCDIRIENQSSDAKFRSFVSCSFLTFSQLMQRQGYFARTRTGTPNLKGTPRHWRVN